ncbi:MAG: hypothetical protein J5I94_13855, partial [Phaeodactylibacter sp.]|nr:hypothetical protein [Phaeodactylibacter sp.]
GLLYALRKYYFAIQDLSGFSLAFCSWDYFRAWAPEVPFPSEVGGLPEFLLILIQKYVELPL